MKKEDNYKGSRQEFVDNLNRAHWKLYLYRYIEVKDKYLVLVSSPERPDAWEFDEDDFKFLVKSGVIINVEMKDGKMEIFDTPKAADRALSTYDKGMKYPHIHIFFRGTITKRDIANNKQYVSIQSSDKKTDITRKVYSLLRLTPEFNGCYLTETNTICIPNAEIDGVFWIMDILLQKGKYLDATKYLDFKKRRYVNR